jgi:hypothetical protein
MPARLAINLPVILRIPLLPWGNYFTTATACVDALVAGRRAIPSQVITMNVFAATMTPSYFRPAFVTDTTAPIVKAKFVLTAYPASEY